MPNGPRRPSANTLVSAGSAAPSPARSTVTRPARVSATKISPFGAMRSTRGPDNFVAKDFTAKPAGTLSSAVAGRSPVRVKFADDFVVNGAGKAFAAIRYDLPGASLRHEPSPPVVADSAAATLG